MLEQITDPKRNFLLGNLSDDAFSEISTYLKTIFLEPGQVLFSPGEEIDRIYFPHVGVISLITVIDDGRQAETASFGFESGFGLMAGIGYHAYRTNAVVQLPLIASTISSAHYRTAARNNVSFIELALRANSFLLDQIQSISACNALHTIEQRLSRWILLSSDRMRGSNLRHTQEMLATILGVTRSSVSEVAAKMQTLGFIEYRRGLIKLIDRAQLEKLACKCLEPS